LERPSGGSGAPGRADRSLGKIRNFGGAVNALEAPYIDSEKKVEVAINERT